MALKNFKPTTPGQRGLVLVDKTGLWKGKPEKSLTVGLKKKVVEIILAELQSGIKAGVQRDYIEKLILRGRSWMP